MLEGRRYVVCLNEEQARKDAADREAIVAALREQLKGGDKSLVGNKGYRKYLKSQGQRFAIDEDRLQAEARLDGKWVLRTNTDLETAEVALKYKQLWRWSSSCFARQNPSLIRDPSSTSATRPFGATSSALCLALILRKALQDRLQAKGYRFEWAGRRFSYRIPEKGRISLSHVPPTWTVLNTIVLVQRRPRSLIRQAISRGLPSSIQLGVLR